MVLLPLVCPEFYHLDTCFCPINEKTALVYPPSFAEKSLKLIAKVFPDLIEVSQHEAMDLMACNAVSFFGSSVVLHRGSAEVNKALRERGFEVYEVETGEFMKSGGSVFCMKMYVF